MHFMVVENLKSNYGYDEPEKYFLIDYESKSMTV